MEHTTIVMISYSCDGAFFQLRRTAVCRVKLSATCRGFRHGLEYTRVTRVLAATTLKPTCAPARAESQAALSDRGVQHGNDREPCLQERHWQIPHGRTVHNTSDAGHGIQEGVPDAPTEWTVNCDAGGACSAGHTCHPVKCTLPTVVITGHPRGEFFAR